jgi:hypothetical protein
MRYGNGASNPNNLVNRITGRYIRNIERRGGDWNRKTLRGAYMGNIAG